MRRWVVAAMLWGVLVMSMAGCGASGADADPSATNGTSNRWHVGVLGPRSGPYDQCVNDRSIEEAFQSADMPSSHLGIKLVASATAEDAQRIADCLRQTLQTGEVSISSPES